MTKRAPQLWTIGCRMFPRLSVCCLAAAVVLQSGCAGLARNRRRDDVVSARRIALRGMDALQAGRWEQAEQLFTRAVDVCPADERVRWRYAEALWRREDRGEALRHMREAVRLSGGDPELLVRLGEMYLGVGELDGAARLAQRTIDSGHQLAPAYRLRGDVLARKGQWREALASYHRALCIRERYPEVQLAVARLYHAHERPQRALSTLQVLAADYPSGKAPVELLFLEGLAYKSLGRYGQAIECLTRVESRGLKTPDVLYHLGEAHYLAGDATNARLILQRVLEVEPRHSAALSLGRRIQQDRQLAGLPK